MNKPKIRVLISLIGKHPDHVEYFIREKGINLKRIHLLHTLDKDQPSSRDGNDKDKKNLVDYEKLAKNTIRKFTC